MPPEYIKTVLSKNVNQMQELHKQIWLNKINQICEEYKAAICYTEDDAIVWTINGEHLTAEEMRVQRERREALQNNEHNLDLTF